MARIEIQPMSTEDREILLGYRAGAYLHGHCVPVAIALHRATGHPLIVLRQSNGLMVHVAVVLSDGRYRTSAASSTVPSSKPHIAARHSTSRKSARRTCYARRQPRKTGSLLPHATSPNCSTTSLWHKKKTHGEGFPLGPRSSVQMPRFLATRRGSNSVVLYEAYGDETGFRARRTAASDFRLERLLD